MRELRHPLIAGAIFLLTSALFSAAYCQASLYYSNQNQYFLHGLALAGDGLLHDDWLVSTRDPTPIFSGLVAFTVIFLHPAAFYAYYAILMGVYATCVLLLFRLVASASGLDVNLRTSILFAALFLATHSALARWSSYRLFGDDYAWFLQAGVAGQYILGAMFQPSTFGVLLVAAVVAFVKDRPWLAVGCGAAAATVHSTYLLSAAMLTAGFMTALAWEGRRGAALGVGGFALALIAPVSLYVLIRFGPTSAEAFAEAQSVLVNVRIPYYALPRLWLDPVAMLQIAWIGVAILLARPLRLRIVLGVAFALGTLLTLVQAATGNDTLALLFPWRISAVLVPIATAVILVRLIAGLPAVVVGSRTIAWSAAAAVLGLAGAGVWIMTDRQGFRTSDEELLVMHHVREHLAPGDVYFIPVSIPKLAATTRGSLSSDFKPLPAKQADKRVIPVNLQRFRLHAGAPIFVDFKAIPYLDVEVLEWHERLTFAAEMLERLRGGEATEALSQLRGMGVTHVVLPASVTLGIERVYEDEFYRVYRLKQ